MLIHQPFPSAAIMWHLREITEHIYKLGFDGLELLFKHQD